MHLYMKMCFSANNILPMCYCKHALFNKKKWQISSLSCKCWLKLDTDDKKKNKKTNKQQIDMYLVITKCCVSQIDHLPLSAFQLLKIIDLLPIHISQPDMYFAKFCPKVVLITILSVKC